MQKKKPPQFVKEKPAKDTENSVPKSIYEKSADVFLMINAKPNSKLNIITGISDEAVDVCVAAPAKDNEANEELCAFLSDLLGIKKSSVTLGKGGKSRTKLVILENCEFSKEEVFQILSKQLK